MRDTQAAVYCLFSVELPAVSPGSVHQAPEDNRLAAPWTMTEDLDPEDELWWI